MKTTQSTTGKWRTRALGRRFLPLFIGIAVPAIALTALPLTSEARPYGRDRNFGHSCGHRQVAGHCSRCNTPIYATWQVVGRDHCGHPRYGWVRQSHQCSHHSSHRSHSSHGHQGSHYSGHSSHQRSPGYAIREIFRNFR